MAANKTFSVLAILSLALGIGANTAIYSFMDSLLLRSLPVSDPESLVVLNWRAQAGSGRDTVMRGMSGSTWSDGQSARMSGIFPFPAFELIRTNSDAVFSSVFAYYPTRKVNVMVKGQAEQASGEFVSGDYFRGLAVSPAAGRLIIPDDDRVGAPRDRRPELRIQSKALRRCGERAGAIHPDQQHSVHRSGSRAAGILRRRSRGRARFLCSAAHQPPAAASGRSERCQGLSRAELLLARNDGAPASGREPVASAGRAGSGVSPMGRDHRSQRSRARASFRSC